MEVEHFLLSKIALQVLSDADRAYSTGVPVNSKSPIFKVMKRLT